MIYFTANTHFGHTGILMHQSSRLNAFEHIKRMNDALIDGINSVVKPDDTCFFLGDFCWKASRARHFRQRLNVRKLHVCQGNHDSNSLRNHVSSMADMMLHKFTVDGKTYKIHLCHYPLLSWPSMHYGVIHLYGHCHGSFEKQLDEIFPGRRSMDVGIDNIFKLTGEWRPISLDEVIERLT